MTWFKRKSNSVPPPFEWFTIGICKRCHQRVINHILGFPQINFSGYSKEILVPSKDFPGGFEKHNIYVHFQCPAIGELIPQNILNDLRYFG